MQKIGLKRDLRCINPCKSGDVSYLKKIDLPTQGGVEVGILGGQKIKNAGIVMNCPENKYIFFTHPTLGGGFQGGGGGWGSKFQKYGKFHELSRKSTKKFTPPPPPKGVAMGILGGQKNQKSEKCHELPRKVITKNYPHPTPPGVGSFMGKNVKCQRFHELSRKSIFF